VKLSGEYSYRISVPGTRASCSRQILAASTAILVTPSWSSLKTTPRWRIEVEL